MPPAEADTRRPTLHPGIRAAVDAWLALDVPPDSAAWWQMRLQDSLAADAIEWGLVKTTREFWAAYPDLGDGIQDFPGPFHEWWAGLDDARRAEVRDFAVWHGVKRIGPDALLFRDVQAHLCGLWNDALTGKAAGARWRRIFSPPDLRRLKDRIAVDPVVLVEAVDNAMEHIERVRQQRLSMSRLTSALKSTFPHWSDSARALVENAILAGNARERRRAVYAAVGRGFPSASVGHVHEHVAVGRKIKRIRDAMARQLAARSKKQ